MIFIVKVFFSRLVPIKAPEMVKDVTFIHLKIALNQPFGSLSAEEEENIMTKRHVIPFLH